MTLEWIRKVGPKKVRGGKRKGCRDLSNHKSTPVSDRFNVGKDGENLAQVGVP